MGECTENVVEMKLAKITSAEECKKKKHKCSSYTPYIVLLCTQYFLQLTLELVAIFFIFIGS